MTNDVKISGLFSWSGERRRPGADSHFIFYSTHTNEHSWVPWCRVEPGEQSGGQNQAASSYPRLQTKPKERRKDEDDHDADRISAVTSTTTWKARNILKTIFKSWITTIVRLDKKRHG